MGFEDDRRKKRHRSTSRSPSRSRSRSRDRDRDKDHGKRDRHKDKKRHRSSREKGDRGSRREDDRGRDDRRSHRERDSRHHRKNDQKSKSKTEEYKKWGNAGSSVDALAARISQKALEAEKTAEERELERIAQLEAEQVVLEEEMRKRRERVKAWQLEKAQRQAEGSAHDPQLHGSEGSVSEVTNRSAVTVGSIGGIEDEYVQGDGASAANGMEGGGGWTLEDEDEEEETAGPSEVKEDGIAGGMGSDENEMTVPGELAVIGVNDAAGGGDEGVGEVWFTGSLSVPVSTAEVSYPSDAVPTTTAAVAAASISALASVTGPAVSIAPSPAKKPSASRFRSNSCTEGDAPQSSSHEAPQSPAVAASVTPAETYVDPLDMFMSSLYDTGDVTEQENLAVSAADGGAEGSFASRSLAGVTSSANASASATAAVVNPFGSNFITLDQIMGRGNGQRMGREAGEDESVREWESDVAFSPKPSADDPSIMSDDEEEERARREFMEALRKSHTAEETGVDGVGIATAGELDGAAEGEAPSRVPEDGLGRVFAGEGDIMDEREVEAKKKSALELLDEARRGKELRPVDHSTIEYLPFRKNLYIVPRVLAKMDPAEVSLKREVLQVKVRGKDCPAPVDSWEQCGLSERILSVIQKNDFEAPFAIQKQAIPAIMCGRDIIGVAKTGSGKTLAFLLPMFRHILDQPPLRDSEGPIGLIMAPARELAFQIYNQAKKFTKALGMRVACVYGGAGVADQIADLKRGADIVVCTPGRMIDILCMQAGKLVTLKRVTMVVMDEADRMFDMGFEPQIRMIIQNVRPDRQTVLFSATFPKQIEKMAKSVLRWPLEIVIGERSAVNKDITQYVEVHDEDEKFMRLLQLLGIWYERGSVLIFVDKQEKCDQLFQDLLKSGYPCLSLHGGKDQLDRDHTLHEFKSQIKTVMVATSVAGRGLDVPEIRCVINYNCPNHVEEYVHRVGRTGRAGRKGTAYTFLTPTEDQYAPIMKSVLEKAGQPVPQEVADMDKLFRDKVSKGEAHWYSGFDGGKGFTFDASEMNEAQKLASMQRRAYEIEQGIITERGDEDEGEPPEDMFAFDDDVPFPSSSSALDNEGDGADEPTITQTLPAAASTPTAPTLSADMTPLERARALAMSLGINKSASAASNSTAAPSPALPPPPVTADGKIDTKAALHRAKMIAMQMSGGSASGGGSGAESEMHYMEELEINDYPPQARRKVTQRNALDDVTERTGVAIISRGSYVPPGRKLEVGERKLFLLIEGPTEMQVRQARMEITRMLEEETIKIGASAQTTFGRYSVV